MITFFVDIIIKKNSSLRASIETMKNNDKESYKKFIKNHSRNILREKRILCIHTFVRPFVLKLNDKSRP